MKKQILLVLVVLMLVNMACEGTANSYPQPTKSVTPELMESTAVDLPTLEDMVAFQTAFPPIVDWDSKWKEYRESMGEDVSVGRAPSEAEAAMLIRSLEQDGIYLTASEEDFQQATVMMADGGFLFLALAISPVTPWPDEVIILGYVVKQGVKYLLIATATIMGIRTVGDLTIEQLKQRTDHTDWKHDIRSVDAQTYINTLNGAPKNDPNMMCAIVRMTSGAIRYVAAQKIVPHLNRAIFGWYTKSSWGGAYIIDTKDFPATSSLIQTIEWVACSQLPPAPPLPQ